MLALCDNIRRLRRARGLSQEELAGRLGVSRQSVSLWEQGVTNPTVENIYAMTEVLGVSFDELLAPAEPVPPRAESVTARTYDELMASSAEESGTTPTAEPPVSSFSNTTAPAEPPVASFSNTTAPTAEPPVSGDTARTDRLMRAEAQYYRYRRLTRGAWIGAGITAGALLLFVFAVAVLGDYAVRYPDSVVNNVIGPSLMLLSIPTFLGGLVTLIIMSAKAGSHRRRMGDLFDLATYEEIKRGGQDYAAKRK